MHVLMERFTIQFQGVGDRQLLLMLLAGVELMLLAAACWRLARRRVGGVMMLAAALGPPAALAALGVGSALRFRRGDRHGGKVMAVAAAGLAVASALGAWLAVGSADPIAPWAVLVGLQVAIATGAFYASVYAYLGVRRLAALMLLRMAAIGALLLILFKPAIGMIGGAGGVALPVLADRSASMSTADETPGPSRFSRAVAALNSQRARLDRAARPVWTSFAQSPAVAPSFDALAAMKPAGGGSDSTDIALAIRQALAKNKDLAAILLVSDGLHNAADSSVADAVAQAGVPIFVAGVGSANEQALAKRNVQIESVAAPLEVVANNVATVSVQLRLTALAGAGGVEVQLLEEGQDQPLATAKAPPAAKADQRMDVELKWTPRPSAASQPSGGQPRRLRAYVPPQAGETLTDDNQAQFHVLTAEPRIRVLYVEGSMRPEYKYLKRLLETDSNIQFMGLVRISGNRFWAQGGAGRLDRLPAGDDDFSLFDVLILGDLDQTFLSGDQVARIRRFVDKGGALLMLGGASSFGPGGYGQTDIEAALPVLVGPRSQPQEFSPFVPRLTAAGQAHPVFEGIADYFAGPGGRLPRPDLPKLPELSGCVTVVREKPGASVLAVHPTRSGENGPLIVLAVQQFGAGRSAALAADTTWNWYMPLQALGADSPYHRFWGQLIRWLAGVETKGLRTPPQALLRLGRPSARVGQAVEISALARDPKTPQAQLSVQCAISSDDPSKPPREIALSASREPAMFNASWQPEQAGDFRVKLSVRDEAGNVVGTDELPLHVRPPWSETDRLARNAALLEQIAQRSGGKYADISRLPELTDQIVQRLRTAVPARQGQVWKLYNFTWLFVAFVVLLTIEWLLRRNWQLQ